MIYTIMRDGDYHGWSHTFEAEKKRAEKLTGRVSVHTVDSGETVIGPENETWNNLNYGEI